MPRGYRKFKHNNNGRFLLHPGGRCITDSHTGLSYMMVRNLAALDGSSPGEPEPTQIEIEEWQQKLVEELLGEQIKNTS